MATSTLGLNQFTKGGQTSLLSSYNADMLKIDNGIAADRARLTAAEQAIADLPTGGGTIKIPLTTFNPRQSGATNGVLVERFTVQETGYYNGIVKFNKRPNSSDGDWKYALINVEPTANLNEQSWGFKEFGSTNNWKMRPLNKYNTYTCCRYYQQSGVTYYYAPLINIGCIGTSMVDLQQLVAGTEYACLFAYNGTTASDSAGTINSLIKEYIFQSSLDSYDIALYLQKIDFS